MWGGEKFISIEYPSIFHLHTRRRRRRRRHHLDRIFVLDQDQVAGIASVDHNRKVTSASFSLEVRTLCH
jgi:hypothetical protein